MIGKGAFFETAKKLLSVLLLHAFKCFYLAAYLSAKATYYKNSFEFQILFSKII
jgi:hypothetical protein